jgi:hypothetical protein
MFFRFQQLGFKKARASGGNYQNARRSNSRNKKNSTNLRWTLQRTTRMMEVLLESCIQVHGRSLHPALKLWIWVLLENLAPLTLKWYCQHNLKLHRCIQCCNFHYMFQSLWRSSVECTQYIWIDSLIWIYRFMTMVCYNNYNCYSGHYPSSSSSPPKHIVSESECVSVFRYEKRGERMPSYWVVFLWMV